MRILLKSLAVAPLWAQISIRDFGTEDEPEGETGEEEVVVSPGQIYVSTQMDTDGDVTVEVYAGGGIPADTRMVFEGTLSVMSGLLSITALAMEDLVTLRMPYAGDWSVKIAVRGEPDPDFVAVVFDKQQWLAN